MSAIQTVVIEVAAGMVIGVSATDHTTRVVVLDYDCLSKDFSYKCSHLYDGMEVRMMEQRVMVLPTRWEQNLTPLEPTPRPQGPPNRRIKEGEQP
jgi:hypothetical protein